MCKNCDPNTTVMKICRTCKREKPLFFFAKSLHSTDLHHSRCKECLSEGEREKYAILKSKIPAYERLQPQPLDSTHNRVRSANARAEQSNIPGVLVPEDILRIFRLQKRKCLYCGDKLDERYHLDHFIPLSRGGDNTPGNIVCACPYCNGAKQFRLPHEWDEWNKAFPVEWDQPEVVADYRDRWDRVFNRVIWEHRQCKVEAA